MSEHLSPPVSVTVKKWTGLGLLLLGLFMLIPMAFTRWTNWWACFITLPAVFLICLGAVLAERSGRVHVGARAVISTGAIIATVALMFLLNLNWSTFWPLMIIVPCAGLVSISIPFSKNWVAALNQEWIFWTGVSGLVLGIEFLFAQSGILPLYSMAFRWWSINIFIVVLGGLIITFRLLLSKRPAGVILFNAVATLNLGFAAIINLFGLNWNLFTPFCLMTIGFVLLFSTFSNKSVKNPLS